MRSFRPALEGLALVAVCALAVSAQEAGKQAPPHEPPKHAAFEQLKKLVGEWAGESTMSGGPVDRGLVTYRLTSGGSALVETFFAGSDHEMLTVYTVDQGNLVLTHYCALGNQPHMKAAVQTDPKVILFTCTGAGGNMASENERHMHALTITWTDADCVSAVWTVHVNGEPAGDEMFNLTRVR
ncbi:MAG: hypothetical protein HZA54_09550 [Planctomycetes bacterium]|nr:hypothetical protein [Planctomycetota bacterium]